MPLIAFGAQVVAQQQFAELGKRHLPPALDETRSVACGDVNGDGGLDLVVADLGQVHVYLNDGIGVFADETAARVPATGDNPRSVALGDVDGDGDLDFVVGAYGPDRLYLNDGTGIFAEVTATRMPGILQATASVAFGDVDGDGDLDLVLGTHATSLAPGEQTRLYLNDGTGTFTDATAARMPAILSLTSGVALGDVDGDGDLDLVLGNDSLPTLPGQNRLYLNNGAGTFTDATAARMPANNDATQGVALADIDGDGDLDLVVANSGQDRLCLNTGAGVFADVTAARMPIDIDDSAAVAVADVDGDADLDLVFGKASLALGSSILQNRLYLNDGTGTYTDATAIRLPPVGDRTKAVAFADVDGDLDMDLVVGNDGANRLYLNDGAGTFADATATRLPNENDATEAVALGDIDGDGDLDLAVGNFDSGGEVNRLYRNDGMGTFVDVTATQLPTTGGDTTGLVFGDVDGDGDLDLVAGNHQLPIGSQNRLFLNNGAGTFTDATAARMPQIADLTTSLAMGDVDGDGDLDIVVGNLDYFGTNGQSRLLVNDGTGSFADGTAGRLPTRSDSTLDVALGDVDGDGDLDLVLGNTDFSSGKQNRLYRNDGTGTFADVTATGLPAVLDATTAVALGDVDGDGDLDIVFANDGLAGGRNRLCYNDGTGVFTDATPAQMPAPLGSARDVVLGDIDRDGDLDLVVENHYGTGGLFLNDGAGTFTDASTRMPQRISRSGSMALGDLDRDGDLDLVMGTQWHQSVYLNLLRQLDAPHLLRIGIDYRLELYARSGPARIVDVALPFLALGPTSLPLPPLGTIGIDPNTLIQLSPFIVPQPAGVGSVTVAVPNDRTIVGFPIFGQALLLQYPTQERLTNVTMDVIRAQ